MTKGKVLLAAVAAAIAVVPLSAPATASVSSTRYLVVLAGTSTGEGFALAGTREAMLGLVATAGGTVTNDLSHQIGVLIVDSPNAMFDELLRASPLVEEAAEDIKWKAFPSYQEAVASGMRVERVPDGGPDAVDDPGEAAQWSMQQIRTDEAHAIQAGARSVDVGILDSGVDGTHADFVDTNGSNVDCARGRDFVPAGPGLGNPFPCVDNQFHGTHVAGIVAARANGIGVVGVAPNVTLVPVKVCDAPGYCYSSATTAGITYAGDARLDVINMSFFVDDDELLESTELKCLSDPEQRAFRKSNERALRYARARGVVPVAALGNSDKDLAEPPHECAVVPAESPGVIGTTALGASSQKATYSSYGFGAADVAAPGGSGTTGDCTTTVLSTIPGAYGCFQGTSMASPHAAGVAALIVSEFGSVGPSGDVQLSPTTVQDYLQATVVDIGLPGYDECFGHGRIDALRAVTHDTSAAYDASAPHCPEYQE